MEQLGIDPLVIGVQIINFFVLFVVLKKYAYKPILSFLEKRQETVEENSKLKVKLESQSQEMEETKVKTIKDAKLEADKIIKEAKLEAGNIRRDIEKQAKEEAKRIIKNAIQKAETVGSAKSADSKKVFKDLISEQMETLLPEIITQKQKEEFTKKAINNLD